MFLTICFQTITTAPPRARLFRLGNAQDGVGLFAQWSPPEGPAKRCDTGMYHVHYTLLRHEACDTDIVSPTTYVKVIGDGSTSTTLDDLVPYATYNVSVVSTNEVGMSDDPPRTWTTVAACKFFNHLKQIMVLPKLNSQSF